MIHNILCLKSKNVACAQFSSFLSFFFLLYLLSVFLLPRFPRHFNYRGKQWLPIPIKSNQHSVFLDRIGSGRAVIYQNDFSFFRFRAIKREINGKAARCERGGARRCERPMCSSVQRRVSDVTTRLWKLSIEQLGGQLCIHVIHCDAARGTFAYVTQAERQRAPLHNQAFLTDFLKRYLLFVATWGSKDRMRCEGGGKRIYIFSAQHVPSTVNRDFTLSLDPALMNKESRVVVLEVGLGLQNMFWSHLGLWDIFNWSGLVSVLD